jgi:hypothetical protein
MSTTVTLEPAPWRAGFRSARANLLPGLVLQMVALGLVVAYYRHAPTRDALNELAEWKIKIGVLFAIVSTGLFGGLLPVLYLRFSRSGQESYSWAQGAAITAFWAYKGLEVDLFYRVLARWVGSGHEVGTIVTKMVLDQFVYCPLFAVPVTVLVYEWISLRFDRGAMASDIRAGSWFYRRVLPLLISNLWVWLPTVAIIYSLPTPLQLPLQNLVLLFFTLLVAHQTRKEP